MCLLAVAHRVSTRFPLLLAANRDEDYERPTRFADWWDDAPGVVGGRDGLAGGAWLAISRRGRFAAVTNLRGAAVRDRSRGSLVREFVTGEASPFAYAGSIDVGQYSGFHLFAGEIGGDLTHLSETASRLEDGIHGVSNAPAGERWPKVDLAIEAVRRALESEDPIDDLLRFLSTKRHAGRIEEEPFIAGTRYGTRASTVIVATAGTITFAERSFGAGGAPLGEVRRFTFDRESG